MHMTMFQLVVWFGGRGGDLCQGLSWYPRVINIFDLPVVSPGISCDFTLHTEYVCILTTGTRYQYQVPGTQYDGVYTIWTKVTYQCNNALLLHNEHNGKQFLRFDHIWLVWLNIYGQIFAIFGLSRKSQGNERSALCILVEVHDDKSTMTATKANTAGSRIVSVTTFLTLVEWLTEGSPPLLSSPLLSSPLTSIV